MKVTRSSADTCGPADWFTGDVYSTGSATP